MILEGIAGGLLRIAPELIKTYRSKKDLDHEYRMLQASQEFDRFRMEHQTSLAEMDMMKSEVASVTEVNREQTMVAQAAGKFVAALSALVRPVVTYWFVALYSAVKISFLLSTMAGGLSFTEAMPLLWLDQDQSILMMLLTFWFTGRIWDRYGK